MFRFNDPRYIAACADLIEAGCQVRDCNTAGQDYAVVRGPGPCAGSELVTSVAGFRTVYARHTGRQLDLAEA